MPTRSRRDGLRSPSARCARSDADDLLAAFARGDVPEEAAGATPAVPSLARVEWEHINRVLANCNGNVSQAARLLGLHRRSLQRKLAKYPVPR